MHEHIPFEKVHEMWLQGDKLWDEATELYEFDENARARIKENEARKIYDELLPYYQHEAELGNPVALVCLGWIYINRRTTLTLTLSSDEANEQAAEFFREAGDRGARNAALNALYWMHENNRGKYYPLYHMGILLAEEFKKQPNDKMIKKIYDEFNSFAKNKTDQFIVLLEMHLEDISKVENILKPEIWESVKNSLGDRNVVFVLHQLTDLPAELQNLVVNYYATPFQQAQIVQLATKLVKEFEEKQPPKTPDEIAKRAKRAQKEAQEVAENLRKKKYFWTQSEDAKHSPSTNAQPSRIKGSRSPKKGA